MFGVSKPICPEASLTHDGTRLLHQRSKRSGKQRVSRKAAAPWSRGCCRSGVFALDILSSRYSIGLPGGGAYAPHKCFAASKTLRRGNLFTPSIQIPRTGGRLRRPEPKKKDMTCGHVFLFCKGRLRSYFLEIKQNAAERRPRIGIQRKRIRFGSEEQRNERAMSFDAKHKNSSQTICRLRRAGARGGSRTRTPLRALAPEASESTNSTTRASG